MSTNKKILTLSDSVIAQIAKIIQVAILTGTDITDNLRMIRLVEDDNNTLSLDEDYTKTFESNIEKMLSEIEFNDSETLTED